MTNWHDLSDKKKASFLALGGAILLFLLFVLGMVWLSSQNSTLNQQLEQQRDSSQSLTLLQNSVTFPALTASKARNIIRQTYKATKHKKISIDSNNHLILTATKMRFSRLLNGLKTLKSRHGIMAINADLKRNGDGIVDAKMTFTHP